MKSTDFDTIDAYIESFPPNVQQILQQVRAAVRQAAPEAVERISYKMPAFWLDGNLVYFAAFRNHIGFYALPTGNAAFQKELSRYKTGKGSIQFPLDAPMPLPLIKKIVEYRVEENRQKASKPLKK